MSVYICKRNIGWRRNEFEAVKNQSVYTHLEGSCNCTTFVNSSLNKLIITLNGQ